MKKISVIGPGQSSLEFTKKKEEEVMAFQASFPYCYSLLNIIPDYWVSGDPNAYMGGFEFLLKEGKEEFKKIKILIPDVFCGSLEKYRKYCGTTPLMRAKNGWHAFQNLLKEVSREFKVIKIPVTTTKFIELYETRSSDYRKIFNEELIRFMSEKIIFGTVKYDSESVIGDRFKWGLENKLSSVVLPVCFFLRAESVKIYGFDFRGPRFYSDIERHPWSDETQEGKNIAEYPLSLVKKWLEWEGVHGMKIILGSKSPACLLNNIILS
jgi:hypothetical protein